MVRPSSIEIYSGVKVHSIQAAVLRQKGGPLKIESLELEDPRDDEVLVRVVASGICHEYE
ncbi:MAG: hypothetical protein Q7V48_07515 [Deltaproteobacteria bacterium]|nr:hypothetical protein [Deltaproteobacteria bacterium]MDO9210580.1 hypothetical protein [Deltaproteobacteria bacterium]